MAPFDSIAGDEAASTLAERALELARDVAQKLGLAAQARQVALDLDIEPELGLARADIGLIERTLTNLIENALAHTPAGSSSGIQFPTRVTVSGLSGLTKA